MPIHRIHGVPTGEGTTGTRHLPSAPSLELAESSGDNSVTR